MNVAQLLNTKKHWFYEKLSSWTWSPLRWFPWTWFHGKAKQGFLGLLFFLLIQSSMANDVLGTNNNDYNSDILLLLVIFILLSRSLSIVVKIGLPIVIGEILTGVILGDLHYVGINIFKNIEDNNIIRFLAEFGAIILMFEIGLESKIADIKKNLRVGFFVALTGSLMTFIAGFLISYFLIDNSNFAEDSLVGVIVAATATGISAKTFKEMKIISSKEVKIILVSSIIDEIISIFAFAIISDIVLTSNISLLSTSITFLEIFAFFVFALIFGKHIMPIINHYFTQIHSGLNMKIGWLLIVCLSFSWVAYKIGMASVIGAFIAGLILEQDYFKGFSKSKFSQKLLICTNEITNIKTKNRIITLIQDHEENNLEESIKPLSHIFAPFFFIYIGLLLNIETLFRKEVLWIVLIIIVVSFTGRIISGYLTGDPKLNKFIIGLGMTPIGEAGLIFAMFGKQNGIIDNTILSAIVATLVIVSIITPLLIKIAISFKGINDES